MARTVGRTGDSRCKRFGCPPTGAPPESHYRLVLCAVRALVGNQRDRCQDRGNGSSGKGLFAVLAVADVELLEAVVPAVVRKS